MVKNIIFDFGGVLMDLDFKITVVGLSKLLQVDFKDKLYIKWFLDLFKSFEKATISEEEFLAALINNSTENPSKESLISVWNAMMLSTKKERFDMLKELKGDYKVYLLSNTNTIHYRRMLEIMKELFGDLDFHRTYFHKAYYSQQMGMRKPDKEIFDTICIENNLEKTETLFIDDLPFNVEGARKAGLHAVQHDPKTEITEKIQTYIAMTNQVILHE